MWVAQSHHHHHHQQITTIFHMLTAARATMKENICATNCGAALQPE